MVAVLNEKGSFNIHTDQRSDEAGWKGLHPILRVVDDGQASLKNMLGSQSQTLKAAVKNISGATEEGLLQDSTSGLELAHSENYVLIDESDSIMETLEPFWGMNSAAIRSVLENALISRHLLSENAAVDPQFTRTDAPGSNAWPAIEVACPKGSPANADDGSLENHRSIQFHFVKTLTKDRDARPPADYKRMHGFAEAAQTLRITHDLTPIFFLAKPSMLQEVLYLSPFYTARRVDYNEADNHDWNEKHDNFYWVGASTEGHSRTYNWQTLHRQRLVLMTEPSSTAPVTLLNQIQPKIWLPYHTTFSNVSQYFDIRITAATPMPAPPCANASTYIPSRTPPTTHKRTPSARLTPVLDMDGNSFSGRFYRALGSKCAVLKQTIIKEWNDGRLVPWVHFIPISLGVGELGEVMRYWIEDDEGRKVGRRIPEEGRMWAGLVPRPVGLELTFLRILMEYGRVVADRRDDLYYE